MTVLVQDTFTRADNSTTLGTTEIGAKTWVMTNGARWGISFNQAYPVSPQWDYPAYTNVGLSDQIAFSLKIVVYNSTQQIFWRIANDYSFFCMQDKDIYVSNGGNWSLITTISSTLKNGDVIRVELRGTEHKIFVNGTLDKTFTHSSYTTSTMFGFSSNSTATRYDDFVIEDFTGGTTTTYTGSGTVQGNSTLTGTEKLILKATGTLQGTSNVSSVEKSILKALGTAQGYSTLTSSETLTQQQGTTYTGSGTAQGRSNLTGNENYRYKANGTLQGLSFLSSQEIARYKANGTAQGISSLSSGETLILFTGNVYTASGTVQGTSTLTSQERMIYQAIGTVTGYSVANVHEVVVMMASGIAQGYSNVLIVDTSSGGTWKAEVQPTVSFHDDTQQTTKNWKDKTITVTYFH